MRVERVIAHEQGYDVWVGDTPIQSTDDMPAWHIAGTQITTRTLHRMASTIDLGVDFTAQHHGLLPRDVEAASVFERSMLGRMIRVEIATHRVLASHRSIANRLRRR